MANLQRKSGVALWRQIADEIRSGIPSGLADDTGRLPGEMELAGRYGVNRHTVRAALSALAHEKVVEARQGSGTFVTSPRKITYPLSAQTRFSAGLAGQADERQISVVGSGTEPAPAAVADGLELAAGTPVVRVETLGVADGRLLSRSTSWFPAGRFSTMAADIADTGSITKAFARHGVARYSRSSTVISASHADRDDTERLGLSPGAIVLVARAVNVDGSGRPVQYAISRFPADRVELSATFDRP